MSADFTIFIEATVNARYADAHEAWTDAESIATHVREECGSVIDAVRITDVVADGESREE